MAFPFYSFRPFSIRNILAEPVVPILASSEADYKSKSPCILISSRMTLMQPLSAALSPGRIERNISLNPVHFTCLIYQLPLHCHLCQSVHLTLNSHNFQVSSFQIMKRINFIFCYCILPTLCFVIQLETVTDFPSHRRLVVLSCAVRSNQKYVKMIKLLLIKPFGAQNQRGQFLCRQS